jgi:hypothetical protein
MPIRAAVNIMVVVEASRLRCDFSCHKDLVERYFI